MTDFYLKAATEQEMWDTLTEVSAAVAYDVKNSAGEVVETRYAAAPGYSIDIIGTIYKPTGNMIQQEGPGGVMIEVPETAAIEGFHANLRGPADLAEKVEYIPYVPTEDDFMNPDFVMPEPDKIVTPSPLASILIDTPPPRNPVRAWF